MNDAAKIKHIFQSTKHEKHTEFGFSKKMIHLCTRLRCYGYNSRFGKDSYGSVHRGEEVKSLFSDDWGNQFITEYGNQLGSDWLLTKIIGYKR